MAKKLLTLETYTDLKYLIDGLVIADHSTKSATFVGFGDLHIVFKGDKFRYEDGMLEKGKIHSLAIRDDDGDLILRASNFTINAESVVGADADEFYGSLVERFPNMDVKVIARGDAHFLNGFEHDDILIGGKGEDRLSGREGRDRLTGGKGEDYFFFVAGYGEDTITDFDADIKGGGQDLMDADFGDIISKTKLGKHNTLLDFGDGDTLTLLNVKPNQIDETDFAIG